MCRGHHTLYTPTSESTSLFNVIVYVIDIVDTFWSVVIIVFAIVHVSGDIELEG